VNRWYISTSFTSINLPPAVPILTATSSERPVQVPAIVSTGKKKKNAKYIGFDAKKKKEGRRRIPKYISP
jgi:hypothetical protein